MAQTVKFFDGDTVDINYNHITWNDEAKCYEYIESPSSVPNTASKVLLNLEQSYEKFGWNESSRLIGINGICDYIYDGLKPNTLRYKIGIGEPSFTNDNDIVNKKYIDTQIQKLTDEINKLNQQMTLIINLIKGQ